nr:Gfo/Idh/MocA family oxidoreductase [Clostridium sp.]
AILGREKSKNKIEELVYKYNIKNSFYNYDELLKSQVDTVYIALPNKLHFEFSKKALENGKNVIIEKPITVEYEEAIELGKLAKEKNLFIFEAISTLYLPNYKKIQEEVKNIGDIKIVQCNFSQYSSRYDKFKRGEIEPVFDPKCAGGALMDLNIYNIHYAVGLFGEPKNIEYYPNIERGIDTSGVLILDYGKFKCICIGAKDCKAPIAYNIQGDKGCIYQDTPANECEEFSILMNDGRNININENKYNNRLINEFIEFSNIIKNKDYNQCYKRYEHSILVSKIQTEARRKSGIKFY